MALDKVIQIFLKQHWDQKSALLVGYSGGSDSKALLYALKEKVPLLVAHVDHGWRKESADEAEDLKKEVEALGIPFFTTRLPQKVSEAEARTERLRFFASIQKHTPYQAVVVGHHGDDLAETVLKRLFEGAHLYHLEGMGQVARLDSLLIWRPFLSLSKSALEKWLVLKGLSWVDDSSNHDPKYLRARMRKSTMPLLEKTFGKNIIGNFRHASERSRELKSYLTDKTQTLFESIKKDYDGSWCLEGQGIPRVELRFLLQRLAEAENLRFSREVLETLLDWISEGKGRKKMQVQHRSVVVFRGNLFFSSVT